MTTDKPKFNYGYIIVLVGFLVMLMSNGTRFCFGVFFVPMSTDLNWTSTMTSWAFSISMFVVGVLGIAMGRLNDRFGPRLVVTGCGLCMGIGYLLMSRVSSLWQLYLFYSIIIGAGTSGFWVPILSTTARWFTRRGALVTAITLSGMGIGTMIMPPVANWFIENYSWRTSFTFLGITALVIIMVAAQFLRRPPQINRLPDNGSDAPAPILDLQAEGLTFSQAARTSQFWLLIAMNYCVGFGFHAIWVHLVPHALSLGISSASAAGVLSLMGGVGIIGRLVMGVSGDRIGYRSTFIICFALRAVSLVWLIWAQELWALSLFGIVFSFAMPALLSPMIAKIFGLKAHGVLLGVIGIGWTLAGTTSPVLAGYISDVTGSYQLAILLSAIFSLIALVVILPLKPIGNQGRI